MSRYDVVTTNVNRMVRFRIEAANAADADTGLFAVLKGPNGYHPYYGQENGTPTANQELAQLRINKIVHALKSLVGEAVEVSVADDSAGTGVGSALIVGFEQDQLGSVYNNAWSTNQAVDKHLTSDVTDSVGTGGMNAPKTRDGLQSLLDTLADLSYDDGSTGPFGDLSAGGAIVLPDGQTTSGAPVLDNNGGGVGAGVSGLTIDLIA